MTPANPRPGKGHRQVPGTGRHDQPVVLDHPRPLVVGQPELRAVEDPAGIGIAKGAPDAGSKLNLDAGIARLPPALGWPRPALLQHFVPGGQRVHGPLAEELGDVQRHHGSADGVLVDEQDPHAGPGRLDGGGGARHPSPNDHQRFRFQLKSLPSIRKSAATSEVLGHPWPTRRFAAMRSGPAGRPSAPWCSRRRSRSRCR